MVTLADIEAAAVSLSPAEKQELMLFLASRLDRADFSRLLGDRFYGLAVMTPGMWLSREREAGRLGRV